MSEATAMKIHQQDCTNMSSANTAPMDMPKRMEKSHEASTLHKEVYATKESWHSRGVFLGESAPTGGPVPYGLGRGLERREGKM